MLAGWVGEGWIYTALLVGTYVGYRTLGSGAGAGEGLLPRSRRALGVGALVLGGGAALGAAGILPRLATIA